MKRCNRWFQLALVAAVVAGTWALPIHAQAVAAGTQTQPQSAPWKTTEELWYTLEMGGGKAGWMSSTTQSDGQRWRMVTDTHMKVGRGATPIEINISSESIENSEGKPLLIKVVQKTAQEPTELTWEFHDDHVVQTSRASGKETVTKQPLPEGEWLPPAAAERYAQEQRKGGAEEITYRTIDPQNGLVPITIKSKRSGREEFDCAGKQQQVEIWNTVVEMKSNGRPIALESVEKVMSDGNLAWQEVSLMGLGKLVTRLSTKQAAQGEADAPGPEMMFKTFITPDKPIEHPMKAVSAKLRLRMKDGVMPDLPAAGSQRVEMSADRKSAVLTININDSLPADPSDAANKEYTGSSTMVDATDELIQKLAKSTPSSNEDNQPTDAMKRANALRKLTNKQISHKGMETAFASASETAKNRTGDCSEHGVLLCALLRANGIPARVASGLVYVEGFAGKRGIFGWHMWTQALIDGKWVDLDATLPIRYHAAHVLTNTSSLSDGAGMTDLLSIIQLIGNLDIDVLEVQYDEK